MGQLLFYCPCSAGENVSVLTQRRFSIAKGRAKSKVLTSSLSPGVRVYGRALNAEAIIPALSHSLGSGEGGSGFKRLVLNDNPCTHFVD